MRVDHTCTVLVLHCEYRTNTRYLCVFRVCSDCSLHGLGFCTSTVRMQYGFVPATRQSSHARRSLIHTQGRLRLGDRRGGKPF